MKTTRKLLIGALAALAILALVLTIYKKQTENTEVVKETESEFTEVYDPETDPKFFDTDSLLVVANKKHRLPVGYEPEDLRQPDVQMLNNCYLREDCAQALEEMFTGAWNDGIYLVLGSAYRAESLQEQLYNGYVEQYGQEEADTISSRPGYSDHQTGLAVDISDHDASTYLTEEFESTEEGMWLKEHAHEYGFIMRYPKGKADVTGYAYEPWHFRYVGTQTAAEIYEAGEWYTFEEYFGISGGDYAD